MNAPRMGRGQFKLVADALKRATPTRTDGDVAMRQWRRTVSVMADALSGTNPAFQRGRFTRGLRVRAVNAAEQAVLRICRSKTLPGLPCMRELHERHPKAAQGKCVIVDNARWDSPILAQGPSWSDVLAHLNNLKVHGTRCELLRAPDSALVCSCPFGRHPYDGRHP